MYWVGFIIEDKPSFEISLVWTKYHWTWLLDNFPYFNAGFVVFTIEINSDGRNISKIILLSTWYVKLTLQEQNSYDIQGEIE